MDAASQIKRQFGEINFYNPVITFKYQRIDIETKLNTIGYLNIAAILLVPVLFLLLKDIRPAIYFLIFVTSLFIIYSFSSGSNKVEIDFFYKRVRIKNKLLLINSIRKLLKLPTTLFFPEIADIYNTEGFYYGRNQTRNFLIIKSNRHRTIRLATFTSEKDSLRLAGLLKQVIIEN